MNQPAEVLLRCLALCAILSVANSVHDAHGGEFLNLGSTRIPTPIPQTRQPLTAGKRGVVMERVVMRLAGGGGERVPLDELLMGQNLDGGENENDKSVPGRDGRRKEIGVEPGEGGGVVTAFEVKGAVDYDKLVREFGSQRMDAALIERLERVSGKRAHHLIRRGFVFSHRDLGGILDLYETGTPFFLYTGRGPSSSSMHIGHLIPFMLTKWLQDAFQVPLVVQLTDDEKYLWKGGSLEDYTRMAAENARDIAAFGLDPRLTFMFVDTESIDMLYPNILRIQRQTTCSQVKGIFGVSDSDSIGKMAFPAVQAAPCFSSSLTPIFPRGKEGDLPCLVPCAIDQDPYFRMTRHVAAKLNKPKPALLHCKFIPALQGDCTKMSASDTATAVYLTDSNKDIKNKINRLAFSGGGPTLEEHRAHGGDTSTDVSYRYLEFFHEDDEHVAQLGDGYRSGKVLSGEMKAEAIKCIQAIVQAHQKARAEVSDEALERLMQRRPLPLPK